ncbi:LAMI_0F07272g1_1 [Lachancea mirantina]|uniref:LAMI_0F07272g1_1 n=1 Tax=Lachancea mirantina TaxID=1230905 RepID=A0A1G4JZI4_9SACH|nr:LAMI_0F07272g1_1 [Lachancea mirantina]
MEGSNDAITDIRDAEIPRSENSTSMREVNGAFSPKSAVARDSEDLKSVTQVSDNGDAPNMNREALELEPDLKMTLPETLDHEDFSKLLELHSGDDQDLFSPTDLLEHGMSAEDASILDRAAHENDVASVSSSKATDENTPQPRPPSAISTNDVDHPPLIDAVLAETRLPDNDVVQSLDKNEDLMKIVRGASADISANETKRDQNTSRGSLQEAGSMPNDNHIPANGEAEKINLEASAQMPTTQLHAFTASDDEQSKISAYARLDFQSFTFYVQTLQVIIGRRSENEISHKVDVNLGPSKSISRRHAQIFYNFGTGRFELSIMGKNGAFVDDNFVERGITVPLQNKTKVQIGQIPFQFVLPDSEVKERQPGDPPAEISVNKGPVKKVESPERLSVDASPSVPAEVPKISKENQVNVEAQKQLVKKKDKKAPRVPKAPKKVYTLEEIPFEFREKPACSYSNLITTCLRKFSTAKGMSLSEIYAGIRELFPYYKYCPDGWQSSVRHNLSLNKSFRKVSKEGKGWLWGLDEEYIAERERQKKRQAEAAAAKAKAAQIKSEQQQLLRAKKAAASANVGTSGRSSVNIPIVKATTKQPNISQTLAANRADTKLNSDANQRTMKHLQEQLMILTKDRKGLDKQIMANILTQALAMTINQVTQAAKSKGITGNPLTALIDRNPQHLNLILAAAVNAATVKVTNGKIKQLVSMPPPNANKPNVTETPKSLLNPPQAVRSSVGSGTSSSAPNVKSSDSFDPSSLSKFFQPKQPPKQTPPPAPRSVLPKKRTSSESESSSEDNSSDNGSGSDGSDDSDGSGDSNSEDEESGSDNEDTSSNEETSDEN